MNIKYFVGALLKVEEGSVCAVYSSVNHDYKNTAVASNCNNAVMTICDDCNFQ